MFRSRVAPISFTLPLQLQIELAVAVWRSYYELWVPAVTFAVLVGLLLFLRVYARAKDIGPVSWRLRLLRLLLREEQLPQVIRESMKPEPDFEVEPCTPVKVEWGGVYLTVDSDKRILTNCSGSAQPSRITAIIGSGVLVPPLHKRPVLS